MQRTGKHQSKSSKLETLRNKTQKDIVENILFYKISNKTLKGVETNKQKMISLSTF
jgi:hypothetical protein